MISMVSCTLVCVNDHIIMTLVVGETKGFGPTRSAIGQGPPSP